MGGADLWAATAAVATAASELGEGGMSGAVQWAVGTLLVVAGLASVWWRYHRHQRLHLRIKAEIAVRPGPMFAQGDVHASIEVEVLTVTLVSRGRTASVGGIGWVDPSADGRADHVALHTRDPIQVPSWEAIVREYGVGDLRTIDQQQPITFWVSLLSGEKLVAPLQLFTTVAEGPQAPRRMRRQRDGYLARRWLGLFHGLRYRVATVRRWVSRP